MMEMESNAMMLAVWVVRVSVCTRWRGKGSPPSPQ